MKKSFVFASLALLVAGSALAQSPAALNANRLFVAPNATASTALLPGAAGAAGFLASGPSTTNNDDSCDIAVAPAATLLLPYFEVDFRSPAASAVNTNFNITNVTPDPQIAHITIWTNWSFPVIDFNIYLTGYDVQGVSLYDIISRGVIPATGYNVGRDGSLSDAFVTARAASGAAVAFNRNANPNFATTVTPSCASLPGPIPASLLRDVQNALTTGQYSTCTGRVGGTNTNAVGYVTIDVANTCSQSLPTDPAYFANEILFDNALIGDYQRINPTATTGNFAGGSPLVHIRAIPEGGPNFAAVGDALGVPRGTQTNFPFTFYDRYTGTEPTGADIAFGRETDRRQPLPGVFAARYIEGGAGAFNTNIAVWREGYTGGGTAAQNVDCSDASDGVAGNGLSQFRFNAAIDITRIVRFDESENPTLSTGCQISPCPAETTFVSNEASSRPTTDATAFPPDNTTTTDAGGWMYLNLNNGNTGVAPMLTSRTATGESQNWVVVQQSAEGRYGIDFDAAYLGNGCSPNPGAGSTIGPLPNFTPARP